MKKSFLVLVGVCMFTLVLVGCSKNETPTEPVVKPVPTTPQAFDTATPEIKAEWDKIVAADAANEYATAILSGRKLPAKGQLTPEQLSLLNQTVNAVQSRMMDAAQKGDAKAVKDLADVRAGWR